MKKTFIFIVVLALICGSANAKDTKKDKRSKNVVVEKVFTSDVDSMSYALGVNIGSDFGMNLKGIPGGKINLDLLIKGFSSALKGDSTLLTKDVASATFRNYITKAQSIEIEKKKKAGEKFLSDNMKKEGVVVTPSGLQYKVIKNVEGGIKPTEKDTVVVNYEGYLVDSTKFDSSIDRGEPIELPLNHVIKGWTEGLQLMTVGSHYKLFIPYNLGYGETGAGQAIPPYAALIFDIDLVNIKPYKEPVATVAPTETKATPANVKDSKKKTTQKKK